MPLQDTVPKPVTISGAAHMTEGGKPLRVYYEVTEPVGATDTIVLLHGSAPGGLGRMSFPLIEPQLLASNFRVVTLDFPGWGSSDTVSSCGSRPELNGRAIAAVVDAVSAGQRVHLMGSSMGAHSAVAFALYRPESVKSLILVSGGTGVAYTSDYSPPVGVQLLQRFYQQPIRENMEALFKAVAYDPSTMTAEVIEGRFKAAMERPEHLTAYAKSFEDNPFQYPDVSSRLHEIEARTLLVWGKEDCVVPFEIGLQLFKGLPNAQLSAFGKCGHAPHFEYIARFNRLVLGFLSEAA